MVPDITVRDCRDVAILRNVLEAAWLRNELTLRSYMQAASAITDGHSHVENGNPLLPRFTLFSCDVMIVVLFALAGQWVRNPDHGGKWRELWETLDMVHRQSCDTCYE